MNYPDPKPSGTMRDYVRFRLPKVAGAAAAALVLKGTRAPVSTSARYGNVGDLVDASEVVWFEIARYGGYVDVAIGDVLREMQRYYNFVVVGIDDDEIYCKVTLKAQNRARGGA